MTTGQYRIVKFLPDPVREEPLNIGLALSSETHGLRIEFPEQALERASQWAPSLDQMGFATLRVELEETIRHNYATYQDTGSISDRNLFGVLFGPVTVSESRWVELDDEVADDVETTFRYLISRLVLPPKRIMFGGGQSKSQKMAREFLPSIKSRWPNAHRNEALVGRSGLAFTADIYAGGEVPMVMATMALGSNWQGLRTVEAKAFKMFDVHRSFDRAKMVALCSFPPLDPERVQHQTRKIFDSIDVEVVTPESVADLVEA